MKKALTSLSILAGSVMIAAAQGINVNTNGIAGAGRVNDSALTGLVQSASKLVSMIVPLL